MGRKGTVVVRLSGRREDYRNVEMAAATLSFLEGFVRE